MEPKRHMLICSNSLRFLDESSYKAVLSELVTYIIVWIYNSIGLIVNNRPLSIKLGKVSLKWRIIIMRSQVCTRNCISPEISFNCEIKQDLCYKLELSSFFQLMCVTF